MTNAKSEQNATSETKQQKKPIFKSKENKAAPKKQQQKKLLKKNKESVISPTIYETEEPDFPRGGAPALTPQEVQEARSKAEADFEKKGRPRKKQRHIYDEEDGAFIGKPPKSIELLRFKNLSVGMKVWGVILEIGRKDMTVSLPGGLRGFVKYQDACDLFEGPEVHSGTYDSYEGQNSLSLKELFCEGQLVSSIIIKLERTETKEKTKSKKRIGLSLKLSSLQDGLTIDAMHEGLLVYAYVSSIEDHGYLLSFGTPKITGFLAYGSREPGEMALKLKKGQLLQCVVSSLDRKRCMVIVDASPDLVASRVTKEAEGLTIELLNPGTLVNARIQRAVKNGLLLSFLTYFTGTVNIFHLEDTCPQSNWHEHYPKNSHVKARILYVDRATKSIGLTLNSFLIQNKCPEVGARIGDVYNVIVRRVDPGIGLLVELSSNKSAVTGYVHISDASDEHINKLEKKFKEGITALGRVIGKRLMDGLAVVTLKDSKVTRNLVDYANVLSGGTIQGEVIRVESSGSTVKVADGIKAFCPLQHMSELQLVKPSKKFQVGVKMKFKVLVSDPESKKITLTHKKTMMQSKLKKITSYEEAVEGLVSHGWISGVEDYGCFVCFYNNVKGLAHRTELGLEPGMKPESVFHVGQVVKCRVLRADPSAKRLSLSFILSQRFASAKVKIGDVVSVGTVVSGVIVRMTDNSLLLDIPLPVGMVSAVMRFEHLSDTPSHIEQLRACLVAGYKFDRLLVLDRDEQRLFVTSKYSLLAARFLPSDISQLCPQQVIQGYVTNITDSGCFVRFVGGLTGLATIPQVSDGFVYNPAHHFSIGQSVRAQVLEVSLASGRFTLSLKQSTCYSTDASLLQGYFLEEEEIAKLQAEKTEGLDLAWAEGLMVGSLIEGEIADIKDYGVIVNLNDYKDVVGFVTHHQLGIEAEVGKHVRARILDVVKSDGIVDLTLRPELMEIGHAPNETKKARRKRSYPDLEMEQMALAVIELIKDEYLVLSLPNHDHAIAFASAHDYNIRVDPHRKYSLGQRVNIIVTALPEKVGKLLVLLTSYSDSTLTQISSKRLKPLPKYDMGTIITGEIVLVQSMEFTVKFSKNLSGRVHITEIEDEYTGQNPLGEYSEGQTITAKIIGRLKVTDTGSNPVIFDLTVKPSRIKGVEGAPTSPQLCSVAALHPGQVVTAYVKELCDDWAWMVLSPTIKGRLFVLDTSDDPCELEKFTECFVVGQGVKCRVARIDTAKGAVDLSLRNVDLMVESSDIVNEDGVDIKKGDIIAGRISKVYPGCGGLGVQVGAHLFGRVHITDVMDVWKDNLAEDFHEGQFVRCCVLHVTTSSTGSIQVDLSLRNSIIEAKKMEPLSDCLHSARIPHMYEKIGDLTVGMEVEGFVKTVSKKGCFITLSRHVDARILLSNLSDMYIEDPVACFPCGKLVKGRVVSIDSTTEHVDVSLKSPHSECIKGSITIKDLHVGDLVSGLVRRVEYYGVFISISNSSLVGLCHISEVSDSYIENLEENYKVGDEVHAKVLKVDEQTSKIFLGMKECYLEALNLIISSGDGDEVSDIEIKKEITDHTKSPPSQAACVLQFPVTDFHVPALEVVFDIESDAVDDEIHNTFTSGGRVDTSIGNESKLSKRMKKRLKQEREAAIRAAERKRLEGIEAPESEDDFERLVHVSPNSSFIWIKYMAYMLSKGEEDKARDIAERALQTINFREEGEKFNVWVAYLNLQNAYGTPRKEATLQIFQRALQYCDPKKLYIAMLGIFERSEQHDMVDELLKTMTQKFKTSAKIWLKRFANLLERHLPDPAHKALHRALKSLPRHKHIKFISQAAIFEFKIGSPERGRGMFEGIIRNYPKRTDLWSVYLDQELIVGDVAVIRALYERATSLELPPKKMKFLFKKYLDFEKSHGDDHRTKYVKEKAMEYVERRLG